MIEDLWIGGWRDIERWVQALFASPDGEDPAQAESWPTRVEITHGTRSSLESGAR